jgi:hypothetical protein
MRNLLTAALAGATALAGVALAPAALAQTYDPYDSYAPPAAGYYDSDGDYHQYAPPPTAYTPGPDRSYDRGYYDAPAAAGSVLGSAIAGYAYDGTPYDEMGPDPNGMIARDGHRIKCKNRSDWDDYRRAYVTRRICY